MKSKKTQSFIRSLLFLAMTLLVTTQSEARLCLDLLSQYETKSYPHLNIRILEYLNRWKQKINPNDKPLKVLYAGIGPDISTPLLTSNATEILGLDIYRYSAFHLQKLLLSWETLDQADPSIPPIMMPRFWSQDSLEVTLAAEWRIATQLRKVRGYYDYSILETWSYERFLLYELKALGVKKESISISEINDGLGIRIEFAWSPNAESKPSQRTLIIRRENMFKYMENEDGRNSKDKADVFVVKSVPRIGDFDPLLKDVATHFLKPHATILVGASFAHETDEIHRKSAIDRTLSQRSFTRDNTLATDETFLRNFVFDTNNTLINETKIDSTPDDNWVYGWMLYGYFRRR